MAQTDREALVALYNATDGPNWTEKTHWGSSAPPSDWYGVTANDQSRVVKLNLGWNNLRGTIPPELGNLRELQHLRLNSNQLTGLIPPELANLQELQELRLSDNQLTGSIPPELGALSKVEWLWLSKNNLTGPIPKELGALSKLTELDLYSNELTGPIPPELATVTTLRGIDVRNNQLSGPLPLSSSRQELLRWIQRVNGQIGDVEHAHAARAVNVLMSLRHFCLPVLDDATDLWLLVETFGGSHRVLWWTCLSVFIVADVERVYTAFFFYYVSEADAGNSL
eukprot:g13512.t1